MKILSDFTTSIKKAFDEIDPNWESYEGLVIGGTHKPVDFETQIEKVKEAREKNIPFLGICHGYQIAFIENARNVLGIKDATSEEYGVEGTPVVKRRPELKIGLHDGESFWSYYDIINLPWDKPKNFIVTPSHPEYQSSVDHPHPLLVKFLNLCKNQ